MATGAAEILQRVRSDHDVLSVAEECPVGRWVACKTSGAGVANVNIVDQPRSGIKDASRRSVRFKCGYDVGAQIWCPQDGSESFVRFCGMVDCGVRSHQDQGGASRAVTRSFRCLGNAS